MIRTRIESFGVSPPAKGLFAPGSLRHAVRAGERCFEASSYRRADVQMLINAGIHRDGHYAEPAFACFIQKELGINTEFQGRQTASFDLLNGGCGLLNAIHVISTLIQSGGLEVGMAVASEANSDRRPDPGYTYERSGAAVLVDASPKSDVGFEGFCFRTFEEHVELYASVVSLAQANGRLLLRRKAELEEAYLASAAPVVEQLLSQAGCRKEQIDLVLPSQISKEFVRGLGGRIGVSADRVVDLSARHGDTLTTSTVLALDEAQRRGLTAPGKRALFLTFGSGVTVGAALYRF